MVQTHLLLHRSTLRHQVEQSSDILLGAQKPSSCIKDTEEYSRACTIQADKYDYFSDEREDGGAAAGQHSDCSSRRSIIEDVRANSPYMTEIECIAKPCDRGAGTNV